MTEEDLKIDRPIKGDLTSGAQPRTGQLGKDEFLERIDSLLAFHAVKSVIWNQYTPYFNDGDATEFGVYDFRVELTSDGEREGDEEDGMYFDYNRGRTAYELFRFGTKYPQPGNWPRASEFPLKHVDPGYQKADAEHREASKLYRSDDNKVFNVNGIDTRGIYTALVEFQPHPFYNVLLENFGDHAQVVATRDGFEIEYYEHD